MTAKEYLLRGWRIEYRIRAAEERLQAMRQRAARIKSAAPKAVGGRGGRARGWEDALDAVCDAEAVWAGDVAALYAVERQVRRAIEGVADDKLRRLLEYRYMHYMSWAKVAEVMGYEVRTVTRLHGRALAAVRVPEGEGERNERPKSADCP